MRGPSKLTTTCVHTGIASDTAFGAVVPPLYLSSNFTFAELDQPRRYDYTRSGNPTRDTLAEALANLEGGAGGVITSTGMSAITLVLQLLSPGDLLVAPHDCYGGTHRLLTALSKRGQFEVLFTDLTDHHQLDAAAARKPRMFWVETPSNPLLRITDLRQVVQAAADALVVADNTFLTPMLQRPLELGADIVVHSTTKYLNGHSDVVGGCAIARDEALHQELAWWANCLGITGAPFDAFLTLRGLRTLGPRLQAHQQNAEALVELVRDHPAVARVHYPGLPDDPGHGVAQKQQSGFGAMFSFELRGGRDAVGRLVRDLRWFCLAESLGGVESLIAHPATMTHAAMDSVARAKAGIGDGLLRVSTGIEATDDLLEDLAAGLERALPGARHEAEAA